MMNFLKNLIKEIQTKFYHQMPACIDEISEQDFGAEFIAGDVNKTDLTDDDFMTCDLIFLDQLDTDFCVGGGKAYAKQATENEIMSWAGAFAYGCKYLGYVPKWGISIRNVVMGAIKFGTPEEIYWEYKKWSPLKPNKSGRNYYANWRNMPQETIDNAKTHKDESMFRIKEKGMDRFDTFRAYLNKFKDKKIVIQTGADAHNITIIGQTKKRGALKLIGIDTYGEKTIKYRLGESERGFRYFSRWEANKLFNGYIAFDMPRALADLLIEYTGKAVKLVDDKTCWLVKDGKRHNLVEEKIAWSHGCLLFHPNYVSEISREDMNKIPEGEPAKFEDGQNYGIIRRIMEKYNIK